MPKKNKTTDTGEAKVPAKRLRDLIIQIRDYLVKLASEIPDSSHEKSIDPDEAVRRLISRAALDSATISGVLALPPGPIGIATILPDLAAIWRRQAQLVADIAAVYGKSAELTRETMMFCLFKHAAAQVVADFAVRAAGRAAGKKASLQAVQKAAEKIGVRLTQRVIRSAAARWLPVVGAIGVGAYAYYDTATVGKTARQFFSGKPSRKKRKKSG